MDLFPKIKPEALVSTIEIHVATKPHWLHVVLEGDDDATLLKRLFKPCDTFVRWHVANGRPNVFRVHRLCKSRGIGRVLFVADADWHRRLGALEELEDVAYTDRNDMECTVLSIDPVLERHQGDFVSTHQAEAFLAEVGHESLFDTAVELASHMGLYRFINHRDKLNLAFKSPRPCTEPPYDSFLGGGGGVAWDDSAFRKWFAARNQDRPAEVVALFKAVDAVGELDEDRLDWCQGHDLIAIHAVLHSRIAGVPCDIEVAGRQLEELLRCESTPSVVRRADVIRRLELFVGRQIGDDEGVA
jgi:hypothetical protein